jgi:hypothetical protein
MQNPWGIPEIVTVAGFPLPKMGGLNPEEKDYMADKIRNVQFQEIAPLAEIADIVVEKEKISQQEAVALIRKTLEGNAGRTEEEIDRLLAFAIDYRNELGRIKKPEMMVERQSQEVAIMILKSRLAPDWILANIDNLKASFRCSLEKEKCSQLMVVPEERWMSDPNRDDIIRQIVRKLPQNLYSQLFSFTLSEEREWAELSAFTNEPEEITLGERSKGFKTTRNLRKKNVSSTENPITPSNILESQTPAITEEVSTVSPVG